MRRGERIHRGAGRLIRLLFIASLALAVAPVAALAQQTPAAPRGDGEVRAAIKQYFENRLRRELQLSDAQVAEILPQVEAMEEARTQTRRTRIRLVRDLRQGLDAGAGDAELSRMLRELEQLEGAQRDREREVLGAIDDGLSVRQQVQLRFFVEEFRRDLQRQVRSIRAGHGRGGGRIGGPVGRKPGARGERP